MLPEDFYQPEQLIGVPVEDRYFNNEKKECFVVEIVGKDYEVCEVTSKNYWANSKKGAYGSGLAATKDDPYKPVRTGLLGQMAFAKVFNQPVDVAYRKGGDSYDNKIFGVKLDIKCATRNSGVGLIYHTNEWGRQVPIKSDIFVFSFVEHEIRHEKRARVVLVGFMTKDDIMKCEVKRGRRGNGHLNYEVPFEKTKSIYQMLESKIKLEQAYPEL